MEEDEINPEPGIVDTKRLLRADDKPGELIDFMLLNCLVHIPKPSGRSVKAN